MPLQRELSDWQLDNLNECTVDIRRQSALLADYALNCTIKGTKPADYNVFDAIMPYHCFLLKMPCFEF